MIPVADAYVESSTPTTNYGTNARLVADASPVRQIFLRFDLSALSGPVQDARLRIHVANVTDAESPSGGTVALVNNTTWTETAITYNNRPTTWGTNVATLGAVEPQHLGRGPVTSAVTTGGLLTLGLRSTNGDGAYYDSRQTTATAPQLIVTTGRRPSTLVLVELDDVQLLEHLQLVQHDELVDELDHHHVEHDHDDDHDHAAAVRPGRR